MNISAIVINKNGEKKLTGCLSSLKFCDEIIVVDAGSTDSSVKLSKEAGATVVKVGDVGFAASRGAGAKNAKGEWLFYVDTDERVTPELRKEVMKSINVLTNQRINSFRIYRQNIILGKWLRHGGWWPDPVHRLIRKTSLKGWRDKLHEHPQVEGAVGMIEEPLIHYSKDSMSEMVQNSRLFAPIEAELKMKAGHPPVKIYHFILAMWREFWQRGIVKAGWLDGYIGILEVFYQMFHQVLVYSTLWQMQHEKK